MSTTEIKIQQMQDKLNKAQTSMQSVQVFQKRKCDVLADLYTIEYNVADFISYVKR
jgi:hypothetical protein